MNANCQKAKLELVTKLQTWKTIDKSQVGKLYVYMMAVCLRWIQKRQAPLPLLGLFMQGKYSRYTRKEVQHFSAATSFLASTAPLPQRKLRIIPCPTPAYSTILHTYVSGIWAESRQIWVPLGLVWAFGTREWYYSYTYVRIPGLTWVSLIGPNFPFLLRGRRLLGWMSHGTAYCPRT